MYTIGFAETVRDILKVGKKKNNDDFNKHKI